MSEQVEEYVDATAELVPVEAPPATLWRTDDPAEVLRRATDTANALRPVLASQGMTQQIQGRDHVKVEGWVTLGSMLGVTPVCTWTRPVKDPSKGWEARVEARTLDGRTIGAAEAMCVRAEKRWETADDYAIRSMAQTRATSKALGSVLRFVVTLAGYSGTPAEEMDGVPHTEGGASAPAPSDKQIAFLVRLLRDRKVPHDALVLAESWARANLTGGKGGTCSETIDALRGDPHRAERVARELVARAQGDAAAETDVPGDVDGLGVDPGPEPDLFPEGE